MQAKKLKHLSAALMASSVLFFAAAAQAGPQVQGQPEFQLAQSTTTNPTTTTPGMSTDTNPDTSGGLTAPDSPAMNTIPGTTSNNTTVNPPTINNNITVPAPANNTAPNRSTTVTPPQTQVEVRNEAPGLSQPAPNIDIDMPDAPDVNVTIPGDNSASSDDQTVTQRTERYIFDDPDDDDAVDNSNILYMAVFGILAVFLIAVIAMAAARRRTVYDDPTL